MKPTTFAILALLSLGLGGCPGNPVPEPYVVTVKPELPRLPAECTSPDPAWVDLPDREFRSRELFKNYRLNKDAFGEVIARRRICRAGILAGQRKTER
jgi:hypothetical protein